MVHDPNYGDTPDVGSNVRLNEPVAIEINQRGYLIYRKQEGLGLEWQEDSQLNPAWNSPDVYQWEFRSMSPQRRDHRTRDIRTKEHLALFNTVAGAYLVYGERRGIDLKWKK
jgi:hypothetical protein